VTSSKLDMDNWTIASHKLTLAQAFGVDKGTISSPELTAKLPAAQAGATTQSELPAGDANPPTAAEEHDNYELGMKMAAAQPYNWTGAQATALNNLWTRESGWNQTAENPTSGAYGIPQALPGSKMASAGSNWQTSAATQIAWGLEYIRSTYGTPVAAWAHELAYGWY
jgi:resuscitation-promoting factor RpfB